MLLQNAMRFDLVDLIKNLMHLSNPMGSSAGRCRKSLYQLVFSKTSWKFVMSTLARIVTLLAVAMVSEVLLSNCRFFPYIIKSKPVAADGLPLFSDVFFNRHFFHNLQNFFDVF